MIGDWKLDFMAKEIIGNIWQDRSQSVIDAYKMIIDCYEDEQLSVPQKQIKEAQMKIQKLRNKITNLIEMRAENEISKEEYNSMRTKLDVQIESLQKEIDTSKEENSTKEDHEQKLETIKRVLSETIDFSQHKLPDYIIDRFVQQVIPIDNKLFKWYIKLGGNDLPPDEVVIGVDGRKGKAMVIDNDGTNRLPLYQNDTGCHSCKQGDEITFKMVIPFELARIYRKSYGRYLRCNQWDDLEVEVYISI